MTRSTETIQGTREEVRKFGYLFASLALILAVFLLYKDISWWLWPIGASLFFFSAGLVGYPILRPIFLLWMKFAFILGWINTRILLGIFFYLVLTPIGLLMRIFGKDFLDEKIDPKTDSYWKRRPGAIDPQRYERLF